MRKVLALRCSLNTTVYSFVRPRTKRHLVESGNSLYLHWQYRARVLRWIHGHIGTVGGGVAVRGRDLKSSKRREKCTGIRRSGRQANRYASESIFARYTTVLYSECIPRHTGMHEHTLPVTLCPPLATLMWHDSQWLPRFATTRYGNVGNASFRPKSLISRVFDYPCSVNILWNRVSFCSFLLSRGNGRN